MSNLYLNASGLFSKWGFSDGDVVDEWYWDTFDEPLPHGVSHHDVLRQLVLDVLVPAIEAAGHRVDLYDIDTIHNPIRAKTVDGAPVPDEVIYGDIDEPAWVAGVWVAVSPATLRALAAES